MPQNRSFSDRRYPDAPIRGLLRPSERQTLSLERAGEDVFEDVFRWISLRHLARAGHDALVHLPGLGPRRYVLDGVDVVLDSFICLAEAPSNRAGVKLMPVTILHDHFREDTQD